ncbi:MAG TPA: hypothetical protein VN131_03370, partial [Mobilitalea sp.]|nr:hypothetical protein [Mobilitalea sp.]
MVIFLAVLIVFGAVLELLSLKDNLSNIRYHSVPSKLGCEPGEVFQIRTSVSNYGIRAIPFLKMEEVFPAEIDIVGDDEIVPVDKRICLHTSVLFIRGKQKVTRTIQASLPSRGLYLLEGSRLLGGDFLGIREKVRDLEQREEIIIYPQLLQE